MKKFIMAGMGLLCIAVGIRSQASQLSPEALTSFQDVQASCKGVSDGEFSIDASSVPTEIPTEHLVLEFRAKDRSIQLRPRTQADLDRGFKQSEVIATGKISQEGRSTACTVLGFRMPGKNKPTATCLQSMTTAVAYLYHARTNGLIDKKAVSDLHSSGKVISDTVYITEPSVSGGAAVGH